MPVIYVSDNPKHLLQDLEHTVKKGYIHPEDLKLVQIVKSAGEAAKAVEQFYKKIDRIEYLKDGTIRFYLKQELNVEDRKRVASSATRLQKYIGKCRITNKYIELTQFPYISFGYLKQFVDVINR